MDKRLQTRQQPTVCADATAATVKQAKYSLLDYLFTKLTGWERRTHKTSAEFFLPSTDLRPLATDPSCQLNVLGHDGHALRMDRAQIGIFEETNQVGLCCLLQSKHGMALEAQIRLHGTRQSQETDIRTCSQTKSRMWGFSAFTYLEILSNLPDKPLERQLPNQQLSALLVLADLTGKEQVMG